MSIFIHRNMVAMKQKHYKQKHENRTDGTDKSMKTRPKKQKLV